MKWNHFKLPKDSIVYLIEASAVIVAIPMYIGVFTGRAGGNPHQLFDWLVLAEAYSGIGMAMLEAVTVVFIMRRANLFHKTSWDRWELMGYAMLLTLTIPIIGLPYLLASQYGISIPELFGTRFTETAVASIAPSGVNPTSFSGLGFSLQVLWTFITLIASPLVLLATGAATVDPVKVAEYSQRVKVGIRDASSTPSSRKGSLPGKPSAQGKSTEGCSHCSRFFAPAGIKSHEASCKES